LIFISILVQYCGVIYFFLYIQKYIFCIYFGRICSGIRLQSRCFLQFHCFLTSFDTVQLVCFLVNSIHCYIWDISAINYSDGSEFNFYMLLYSFSVVDHLWEFSFVHYHEAWTVVRTLRMKPKLCGSKQSLTVIVVVTRL